MRPPSVKDANRNRPKVTDGGVSPSQGFHAFSSGVTDHPPSHRPGMGSAVRSDMKGTRKTKGVGAFFKPADPTNGIECPTNGSNVPPHENFRAFVLRNPVLFRMGTETDESVHASETLGPAQGTAPSTGQESLPADFSRAVALLRRPVAQPVIDALLMDPDALIEAAKNILPRVPRSRKEIRRNEERPWKSQAGNDLNLSAAQIDAVVDSSTVGRLRRRYEVLLQNVDLPTEGFTTKDQAQAAGRLVSTYNNLRKRQLELGLKTTPKDDRITEAHRLRVAFQRQEKKSRAAAPTRRGRPPRVATLG